MSRSDMARTGDYGPLLSGDDLERIDCVGGDEGEHAAAVRTAMFHRQEAMDLRDEVARLRALVVESCTHLDHAGFCVSADRFRERLGPAVLSGSQEQGR